MARRAAVCRGGRRGCEGGAVHVGDVDSHASPSGVDPAPDGSGEGAFGERCCLVVVIAIAFALVGLPALIWTLGIACGAR